MITWAEIVLLILKIADAIMLQIGNSQQFQAGTDAEIAKTAASVLIKTRAMQNVRDQVNALTDTAVDDQLRGLEPK
jgi:hypothetical protein